MEKFEQIINNDAERMRVFAIKTLAGVDGDYLRRLLQQHPNANWPQIRDAIVARFSDLADQNYALRRLRQTRQGIGESVQSYGERILSLAEDAYPGQPMNQPAIQRELIDVFIEGLREDATVKKLLRNRPADVYAAIEAAMEEQQVTRVFKAQRRKEEPMEVDMVLPANDLLKELNGKLDLLASSMVQMTEFQKQQSSYRPRGQVSKGGQRRRHEYTSDGKPICSYCKRVNHIMRDCRKRQYDLKTKSKGSPTSDKETKQQSGNY